METKRSDQTLEERIRTAASSYDGHVTNGSHAELMKIVKELQERAEHWEQEAHTLGHMDYANQLLLRRISRWVTKHCETEKDMAVALEGVRYELREADISTALPTL